MIKELYAGSPDAAAKTFKILNEKAMENGFEIAGVLTNPPSAKGRHKELVPTAVGLAARKAGIPVLEPEKLDGSARDAVAALQPDMLVCFAYGHIFGPKFMELFRFGGINLHPSALPQFRGCTPVNAAILNGLEKTAFSVQKVSAKMDEGNILAQVEVCLDGTENAAGNSFCETCGTKLAGSTVAERAAWPSIEERMNKMQADMDAKLDSFFGKK